MTLLLTPQEFDITVGMLAQYRLEYHGWYLRKKPQSAFKEYPERLPGAVHMSWMKNNAIPLPKYVIHVAGEHIIRHPRISTIGTRFLKCFITVPERTDKTVHFFKGPAITAASQWESDTIPPETHLGWVIDDWLEPLNPELTYRQELDKQSKSLSRFYLEKLRTTGRIKDPS